MNVKIMRIKKGVSQKEFAKMIGISNVTLVKIEKDDIDGIKIGTLKKVAAALDTTVQELFF